MPVFDSQKESQGYNFITANDSKRIEKYFLDLRNMFSIQENIRIFFSKQEK